MLQVGTIFLWIFWPSFNGALASGPAVSPTSAQQFHCVANTVLSLLPWPSYVMNLASLTASFNVFLH